jgi:MFS family permease
MASLIDWLGIQNYDNRSIALIKRYFSLLTSLTAIQLLADAFLILFILDTIGYESSGKVFATLFFVQALIDYPTGVLADWIGHKRVLFLAYIFHMLTFGLLGIYSQVNPSDPYKYLMLVAIMRSVALAQESGCLQSWFDNSYNDLSLNQDPDKKIYGSIFGKTTLVGQLLGIIMIMLGGFVASTWSRETLFLFQAGISVIFGLVAYRNMTGFGEKDKTDITIAGYAKMLLDGIKVVYSGRIVFFLTLGWISLIVFSATWLTIFLFPIYFGYTGTDMGMSSLRTIIFALGVVVMLLAITISKKLKANVWIPRISLIFAIVWTSIYVLNFSLFPLPLNEADASLNIPAIVLVIIAAIFLRAMSLIFYILFQREALELVPNENRNSYNSFLPTVGMLISSLLIGGAGYFIDHSQNMLYALLLFLFIPLALGTVFAYIAYHKKNRIHDDTT